MTLVEGRVGNREKIFTVKNIEQAVLWLSTVALLTSLAMEGKFKSTIREQVRTEQDGKCGMCGKSFRASQLQTHHVLPKFCGGADTRDNAIMLCKDCHSRADRDAFDNGVLVNGLRIPDVQETARGLIGDMRLYNSAAAKFRR